MKLKSTSLELCQDC